MCMPGDNITMEITLITPIAIEEGLDVYKRQLVDVSHSVIVREYDCGTDEGVEVRAFTDGKEVIEPLKQRIVGRTALVDIKDPETGEVIVEQNEEILEAAAERIENSGIESVAIRSVMTCHSRTGICARCYGRNLATGEEVNIGEAVGITAAQSIGEPGTQLTMRTFHTGGVAGGDITQGLPRVEAVSYTHLDVYKRQASRGEQVQRSEYILSSPESDS